MLWQSADGQRNVPLTGGHCGPPLVTGGQNPCCDGGGHSAPNCVQPICVCGHCGPLWVQRMASVCCVIGTLACRACCSPPPPGWQAMLWQAMLWQSADGHWKPPLTGGHCGLPTVIGQSWPCSDGCGGHCGPKCVQTTTVQSIPGDGQPKNVQSPLGYVRHCGPKYVQPKRCDGHCTPICVQIVGWMPPPACG